MTRKTGGFAERSLRMVHVTQPVEAGVASVVEALALDQVRRGWTVSVVCASRGDLPEALRSSGIEVQGWEAGRHPGPQTMREARDLAVILGRLRPDIVHLHSSKAGLAGRTALRGTTPTVFQPHGWSFDAVTGPVRSAAVVWERLSSRWTSLQICVSEDELAVGRSVGVDVPSTVIHNGVDTDRFSPRDRAAARARLSLPLDVPIALCVGRICRQKGQDLLLAAWPAVREQVPSALAVFVGARTSDDGVTQDERPGVLWAGPSTRVEDWYAACDVAVMPSRWEGMALVPLEAMASGRPVVGFAVSGARESVGGSGAVVPVGAIADLAHELTLRLVDARRAAREGELGRVRALERFSLAGATESVARAVEVLARRPGRAEGAEPSSGHADPGSVGDHDAG